MGNGTWYDGQLGDDYQYALCKQDPVAPFAPGNTVRRRITRKSCDRTDVGGGWCNINQDCNPSQVPGSKCKNNRCVCGCDFSPYIVKGNHCSLDYKPNKVKPCG